MRVPTIALVIVATANSASAAVTIDAPVPHQVVQRGVPAVIVVKGASAAVQWRVVPLTAAFGRGTDWAELPATGWMPPAGGWYRLEVRAGAEMASVEPFGVGEVFLSAGQSYGDNCNDEKLKVAELQRRVVAFDMKKDCWRVADDPQPNISSRHSDGSIWPAFGDELARTLEVPIGLVSVSRAATSSAAWLPEKELHKNLVQAAKRTGRFRAVLWQQGESDVIGQVPAEKYVENLKSIRAALVKECGFEVAWLPAKSTIHPTVYNNPKQEAVIRSAIDQLWQTPGFHPGPDTDTLTGENRGKSGSKRHFSPIGQRRAAALWVDSVKDLIGRTALPDPPAKK